MTPRSFAGLCVLLAAVVAGPAAAATVTGTVYMPDGVVPGVTISITDSTGRTQHTYTSADGEFVVRDVDGRSVLRAELAGLTPYERVLCPRQQETVHLTIALNLGASFGCWIGPGPGPAGPTHLDIQGEVLDEGGLPLDGVFVEAFARGSREVTARTDAEGKVRFVAVVGVEIHLSKPGFAVQTLPFGDMSSTFLVRMFKPCP